MTESIIAISSHERCFADDVVGQCARCQRLVYYRPHAAQARIIKRYCLACFPCLDLDDVRFVVTRETLAEIVLLNATQKGSRH